jgi:hypothetical protein
MNAPSASADLNASTPALQKIWLLLRGGSTSRIRRLNLLQTRSGLGSNTLECGVRRYGDSLVTSPRAPVVKFLTKGRRRPLKVEALAESNERSSPRGLKSPWPSRRDLGFLRHRELH